MPGGNCVFNQAWTKEFQWLRQKDRYTGTCTLCQATLDIRSMGKSSIVAHKKGKKHAAKEAEMLKTTAPISDFVQSEPSQSEHARTTTTVQSQPVTQQPKITVPGSAVLRAEVLITLDAVSKHHSFKSCEKNGTIFAAAFPDSEIAKQFKCSETKSKYLCVFGIAPFFLSEMKKNVRQGDYVLLFDESLNRELKKKQLDIHVRYWNDNRIQTDYFTSEFLGHAKAADICETLEPHITQLGQRNLLQISMDGPNVNWKVFDDIQKDVVKSVDQKLLNIGSCGLHILHNSFRAGCAAAGWEIEEFLGKLYTLFLNCPARREDFVAVTQCTTFPLKFCNHRWLENVEPAERAIELVPYVEQYCTAAKLNKAVTEPTNQSFRKVTQSIQDPLLVAKLHFFAMVARQMQPFLEKYQTDKPMVPFLATDLFNLLKGLMERFIKEDVMSQEGKSLGGLTKIDIAKSDNGLPVEKIKVGMACTRQLLKTNKASDRQKGEFRLQCRDFLRAMVQKMLLKSPACYPLVKHRAYSRARDARDHAQKVFFPQRNLMSAFAIPRRLEISRYMS